MNYSVAVFASIGLLLLLVMAWLAFSATRHRTEVAQNESRERECIHISNLPQIKQALADSDFIYLENQGYPALAKRIRKERRRIALNCLEICRCGGTGSRYHGPSLFWR